MNSHVRVEAQRSIPTAIDYKVYHDPEIFAAEQSNVFKGRTWCYLGLEAEIPNAGDFRTSHVGETPVVLVRGQEDKVFAWVNRCAHKGATVCRSLRGNQADGAFVCVYHQWAYDSEGTLVGVPFRRGMKGVGGYDKDFNPANHSLEKLRVESYKGMIFGTFSSEMEALEDFLGPVMRKYIDRVFHRPIKVLGYARQYMSGNWKLYSENSRDSYHGALLHLFYPTFGIYRQSQDSSGELAEQGFHNVFTVSKPKGDIDYTSFGDEANREMQGATKLQDERLLQFRPEIDDDVGLHIQSLFPNVVLQQIQNTLATRQIVTHGPDKTELVWTYFGYADDNEETTRHRLRNLNLVGPSGLISMEDGEAVELCQQGTIGAEGKYNFIEMGGDDVREYYAPMGMDENAVRGFWKGYLELMGDALSSSTVERPA
ncbi:Rieske (2Fe-2S) protein [Sphingopyxis bauzanensis]|jgi:anthranilate 1,2-dioxygenase large subunit|uniref:Rieske (2Fe-2S) protein n=1 Tax=Sphingopyxis bauzanensis TaxID=651663 RepID=A0A246JJL5_9SPHN|nr:aromatic ring-hydroxylating dioxygenase subunit alpha [Sphingopyxis bauzanensis]OWQ92782.1 Rieske (2Fe-2S) protein [Sphingopyxis bauzanensis]GGJ64519.1 aromatic oxygenase [Sphingopyxis bauzanensis]|tara:strand:+ start:508 stop:1788 length:1281 start_codon:yes stop_codon:yes gene_type:complete